MGPEALYKFHKELFFVTSNKVILPKNFFNCMHGLKSAILAISQKLADWLDWPCPVSALQEQDEYILQPKTSKSFLHKHSAQLS